MTQLKHSAVFIAEMKTRLHEEEKRLQKELASMASKHGNDYEANFPDYGRSEEDNATEMGDYAATAATEKTLEMQLKSIQEALERIDAGAFGVTTDGKLIPEERLRANPAATTIISK